MTGRLVLLACLATAGCSGERDLRDVRHQRSRTATQVAELYENEHQGDWMLEGKVIFVTDAIVTEVGVRSNRVVAECIGRDSLSPLLLRCVFHPSEKRARTLRQGDVIHFKAVCRGLDRLVTFDSGLLIGLERPVSGPS